jgi:hypothetical protein
MKPTRRILAAIGAIAVLPAGGLAADHLDSVDLLDTPAADINDLYAFTTSSGDRLVIAMSVNRFANIPSLGGVTEFDPNTLYQFKIDNSDPLDGVADHIIDVQFNMTGTELASGSHIRITGLPALNDGDATVLELGTAGTVVDGEVSVFAGLREDPFFFDLVWFFDVGGTHPLSAVVNDGDDFYHNVWAVAPDLMNAAAADTFMGANVSMIVLEFPTASVLGTNNTIGVWAATRQ